MFDVLWTGRFIFIVAQAAIVLLCLACGFRAQYPACQARLRYLEHVHSLGSNRAIEEEQANVVRRIF